MGFRFRKRIKIAPGVKLNLSKSGPSVSLGGKGFTYNVGRRGRRTTVSLPHTGLSYVTQTNRRKPGIRAQSRSTKICAAPGSVPHSTADYIAALQKFDSLMQQANATNDSFNAAIIEQDVPLALNLIEDTAQHLRHAQQTLTPIRPPVPFATAHYKILGGMSEAVEGAGAMVVALRSFRGNNAQDVEAAFMQASMQHQAGVDVVNQAAQEAGSLLQTVPFDGGHVGKGRAISKQRTAPRSGGTSPTSQTWQWTEGRDWRRAGMVLLVGGFVLALTPAWALGILCLFAGALILLYWGVRGIGAKSQWKRDQAERSASDEPL